MTLVQSHLASVTVSTCSVEAASPQRTRVQEVANTLRYEYGRGQNSGLGLAVSEWSQHSHQKRVWTVSTPWASDSVVPASDWPGLGALRR